MIDSPAPRHPAQRKADVLAKLAGAADCWVASASARGDAYLIPLSYLWDGQRIVLATPGTSRTARNLRRAGRVRLGWGPTRDVVIVEGTVTVVGLDEVDSALADGFAAAAGFDPRRSAEESPYVYLVVTPQRIQAWREANELAGREVMVDGEWQA